MANAPSADEQFLLELINRFRANPAAEAALLTGAGIQNNVLSALNYFGVSTATVQQQLAGLAKAAPLAWSDSLATAADGHNQAMIAADQQTHQAPGEPDLGQRAINAGYSYRALGENVYAFAADVVHAHAGFVVDWGYDAEDYSNGALLDDWRFRGDGIQDPAGHRNNLLNGTFTEVGISLVRETNPSTQVGPLLVTQDFGTRFNYAPQLLGVVFNDADRDAFYDVGEGLGGVSITLQSTTGTFSTTSTDAGGWQIAVPSGAYNITFSGGGLTAPVIRTATLGTINVKVDAIAGSASDVPLTRPTLNDYNGDGRADILWRNDNGTIGNWLGTAAGAYTNNSAASSASVTNDWKIAATGDFNGDGRNDILWRNDNGTIGNWLGTAAGGYTNNSAASSASVTNDWKITATGDFNGDGRTDILWRNDNGTIGNWLGSAAGGYTNNSAASSASVTNDWKVVATGDFNGDGRTDILWRNDNGTIGNWLGTAAGGYTNNSAASSASVTNDWKVVGTGDFNGDGRTDILWRNDNGTVGNWLGTAAGGFTNNSAASSAAVSTDWKVASISDYNGDGRADILWRNDNGTIGNWLGTAAGGYSNNSAASSASVSTDWRIAGTTGTKATRASADFNGDGRADILWRNDNGTIGNWLGTTNGGFTNNGGVSSTLVPTSWKIAGTGDFNGDGRTDILWRNADGTIGNWLGTANGGYANNSATSTATVSADWKIVGTGDFNGDGRTDILWRNDNGTIGNWLGTAAGGFSNNAAASTSTVANTWKVAGTGDFNGDGRDDILWRNDNGQLVDWLGTMSGGFADNSANAAATVSTDWKVAGVGDFNGDGRSDILWRNDNGALVDWLGKTNGGFSDNGAASSTSAPIDWKVAGTGDFNGDGRDDILWRNNNGQLTDWVSTTTGGFVDNSKAAFTSVSTDWRTQNSNLITI